MIKRALISVYNKTGILEMANFLQSQGVEIISTGGTYKHLKENNIDVIEISEVTGFQEMLDGRVKTLHPKIHGGILAIRDNQEHMRTIQANGIKLIDMVIVNLYPFFEKVNENINFDEKVEFIDIGGPTMIRAAAKNFKDVIVLTDVNDYGEIINQLKVNGDVDLNAKRRLAGKVFNLMSAYDGAISRFLLEEDYPEYYAVSYKKVADLRYGENPHQSAAYYVATVDDGAMKGFEQLNGKELSYNNIKDMDVAWKVVCEFDENDIVCCALKHNTPCGAAIGVSTLDAYKKTFECDSVSIYGGIVAFNKIVDLDTAVELAKIFIEIVIAPGFTDEALEVLYKKKNLRVIKSHTKTVIKQEFVTVDGGLLVQSSDNKLIDNINFVTQKRPNDEEMENMIFGMKIAKYVKSNAIVIVKDKMAKGIAGGQVNRIWAAVQAIDRAGDGVVMVSDAFFPFSDVVDTAAKANIKAIMQPGGSIHDKESIDACNKYEIPMVFTGIRHFKH